MASYVRFLIVFLLPLVISFRLKAGLVTKFNTKQFSVNSSLSLAESSNREVNERILDKKIVALAGPAVLNFIVIPLVGKNPLSHNLRHKS